MTLFWIIVAVAVAGLIIWYLVSSKKKGPALPKKPPEAPLTPPPPPSPPTPPPPPPGTPGM